MQLVRFARFVVPALYRAVDEMQTAHCVRHRAIDELVLAAVERDGFRQVVVVGAGYDMRCARFAGRLRDVRWLEVDQPAMMARKRRILDGAEGVPRVTRLAADVAREPLHVALARGGLDDTRPTCVVLEGILHYLPPARLPTLLDELAAIAPRVRLVASYIPPAMAARASALFLALVRGLDELPRLHLSDGQLRGLFEKAGFVGFRAWSPAEQTEAFAPMARSRRIRLGQWIAQAEKRP